MCCPCKIPGAVARAVGLDTLHIGQTISQLCWQIGLLSNGTHLDAASDRKSASGMVPDLCRTGFSLVHFSMVLGVRLV